MKLTIESTDVVTSIDGTLCRLWRGATDDGQSVLVFVLRVGIPAGDLATVFAADVELVEKHYPIELEPYRIVPLREIV